MTFQQKYTNLRDFYLVKRARKLATFFNGCLPLGLCPKLWVGGSQKSYAFCEVSDLRVYIVFWVILSIPP